MKKLLAIMMLLMYGLSSTGMTLHFYYCCGKLDKVNFISAEVKHCNKAKQYTAPEKQCCDNKEISLKITSEQTPGKILYSSVQFIADKATPPDSSLSSPIETIKLTPEVFAPPPLSSPPLFILNCVFRI
jgi:hypothetical protein